MAKSQHSVQIIKAASALDLPDQKPGPVEITTLHESLVADLFLELADEALHGAHLAVVPNVVKNCLEIEEKAGR
jgi:hypothetical protein